MRFLPANAQHIGARHSQQDSFAFGDPADGEFIDHGGFIALVCDGMGGMEFGDAASRTAARAFLDAYHLKSPAESIPAALERSVRTANDQVVALAHKYGLSEGMGTTLVAAALQDRSLYFVSVGDSGLFLSSGGRVRMINRPHVFANVLDAAVERGALSRADAENHPERESLTSFIGAETLDEIDSNPEPYPISEGDVILLASDGLFKTLSTAEILACLQGDPQSWPDTLVEQTLARKREHQDNVTVLAIAAQPGATLSRPPRARRTTQDGAAPANHSGPPAPSNVRTLTLGPAEPHSTPLPAPLAFHPAPASPSNFAPAIPIGTPAPPAAPSPRSRAPWLILILVLALAGAGWWYLTQYRGARLRGTPAVTEPGDAVRPPAARPAAIKVDPDAPVDTPLRPVPPPNVARPEPQPPH